MTTDTCRHGHEYIETRSLRATRDDGSYFAHSRCTRCNAHIVTVHAPDGAGIHWVKPDRSGHFGHVPGAFVRAFNG